MIRIAICDDDIHSLEDIYLKVNQYATEHPETDFFVRRFHSVYDLLECLDSERCTFHIYLLDIVMPLLNGIEVGLQIRKSDTHAVIIYLTLSPEFALESFKTSPLSYLIKPIGQQELSSALTRAIDQLQHTLESQVLVRTKEGLTNILFNQILYVEYQRHSIVFHLSGNRTVSSMVLRESFTTFFENYLSDPRFLRPHASYAVNMDHVQSLTSSCFELKDGTQVPVSKRIHTQVKRKYMDYLLSRNEVSLL